MTEKSVELSAKQEQIIADWQAAQKGNLNKWYVAEAQYLVRLANDHLTLKEWTERTIEPTPDLDKMIKDNHERWRWVEKTRKEKERHESVTDKG